jgi:hypothetical protein
MRVRWLRRHFLGSELFLGTCATGVFAIWAERWHGFALVDEILEGNRGQVYAALASIFGSLLGFIIATASIVVAFQGLPRLRVVRDSSTYPVLWRVFTSAIRWLGAATIGALIALVFDNGHATSHLAFYFCFFTTLVAMLRVARSVWVIEQLIHIVVIPPGDRRD